MALSNQNYSPAKHGDAYFSAVFWFMKDLIAAPGPVNKVGAGTNF